MQTKCLPVQAADNGIMLTLYIIARMMNTVVKNVFNSIKKDEPHNKQKNKVKEKGNMTYTDTQLKQALAKMLPKVICMGDTELVFLYPSPYRHDGLSYKVLDTELLHLCWLVESDISEDVQRKFRDMLRKTSCLVWEVCHATWQQRITALAKTLNIEIV